MKEVLCSLFSLTIIGYIIAFGITEEHDEGDYISTASSTQIKYSVDDIQRYEDLGYFYVKIPCHETPQDLGMRINRKYNKVIAVEEKEGNQLLRTVVKVGDILTGIGSTSLSLSDTANANSTIVTLLKECLTCSSVSDTSGTYMSSNNDDRYCKLAFKSGDGRTRQSISQLESQLPPAHDLYKEFEVIFHTKELPGITLGFDLSVIGFTGPDTLAERLGVVVGDTLTAINGRAVDSLSATETTNKIKDAFVTHQIRCRGLSYCSLEHIRRLNTPSLLRIFRNVCILTCM